MTKEVRVTTVDNPYDPFNEWDDWLNYDMQQGYRTCERLASITALSEQLTDQENMEAVEDSIDRLIRTGAINKKGEIIEYKKVYNFDRNKTS